MELIGLIFVVWILYQILKRMTLLHQENYSSGQTNYEYRGNYSDKKNEYAGQPSKQSEVLKHQHHKIYS